MKKMYLVEDDAIIQEILTNAKYGTLALCYDDKPYSLPINFVHIHENIYFHGAKKGRKIDIIQHNANASFSVVESLSLLPSYFSNDEGNACPATHLFKSICIEGSVQFVTDYEEKVKALEALMQKLQPEGGYTPLDDGMYTKMVGATEVFKLIPTSLTCKAKLGQNFTEERYQRVTAHLQKRGSEKDLLTLQLINTFRDQ